jgi:hypothetical protein
MTHATLSAPPNSCKVIKAASAAQIEADREDDVGGLLLTQI